MMFTFDVHIEEDTNIAFCGDTNGTVAFASIHSDYVTCEMCKRKATEYFAMRVPVENAIGYQCYWDAPITSAYSKILGRGQGCPVPLAK